ncbi:MAG: hypothetical protein IPL52_18110 [Flavobacteriales bacterium]|nr:hypothetical protein [Flavobacteriales bacterium]
MCATLLPASAQAQALEGIVVEKYHQLVRSTDTLTTYRIYVDLAPEHTLQMVFGSTGHPLRIESTTEFFNDTLNGAMYGDRIDADRLAEGFTALDSWITINAGSDAHAGLPLDKDTDGSVLRSKRYRKSPLARADGLVPADVKQVVDFKMQPGYLGNIRGTTILCVDCAWSVLGGTKGVTTDNMVLIAQISTTGVLSYELNLQIGRPGGGFVRYVAMGPQGDEIQHPALDNRPQRLRR